MLYVFGIVVFGHGCGLKIFSSKSVMSFHALHKGFHKTKRQNEAKSCFTLRFDWSVFLFIDHNLGVKSKNSLRSPRLQRVFIFFWFIVVYCMVKFMIQFELILIESVKIRLKLIFFFFCQWRASCSSTMLKMVTWCKKGLNYINVRKMLSFNLGLRCCCTAVWC